MTGTTRMSTAAWLLARFHVAFYGEPFGGGTQDPTLRIELHREETEELVEAIEADDRTAIAHELADVVIVAYGTAHSYGIPLDRVIEAVMEANFAKVGPDGQKRYRADGKLLKPPGWRPADVAAVLAEHARRAG